MNSLLARIIALFSNPKPLPKHENVQYADHVRNKYGIPVPFTEED